MIVLFNPGSAGSGMTILPMSLLSLAAVLEGFRDHESVGGNLVDDPLDDLRRDVGRSGARIPAVTVMPGRPVRQARDVGRVLKQQYPDLVVIRGGYFSTMYPQVCADAACV